MIKSFSEFNRIDESVLYYAPPFREQLEILKNKWESSEKGAVAKAWNLGSDIASKLLELEMEDLPTDITFVNSAEDVGYLTFHPMAKAIEKIKKNYNADHDFDIQVNPDMEFHDIIYNNEINGQTYMSIYTGNKNAVKIGKFIKKVLPTTTDAQIEEFVNELKAVQDNLKEKIELVSGDEIAKWYKSENCYSGGSLGSSCMVDKNFFDIYTQNPESVNLLIMKSGDNFKSFSLEN
jgi:hypothetical protein